MKFLTYVALLAPSIGTTFAQMIEYRNIFRYFRTCQTDTVASYEGCESHSDTAQCCIFQTEIRNQLIQGEFCVKDDQRNGQLIGQYTDLEYNNWSWYCFLDEKPEGDDKQEPEPTPDPEPEPTPDPDPTPDPEPEDPTPDEDKDDDIDPQPEPEPQPDPEPEEPDDWEDDEKDFDEEVEPWP